MCPTESQELLRRYLAGDADAATAIFDRYLARLLALARRRISKKLQRRVDPEDVVQSAYRSFFVQASSRDYQLRRAGDLWRLLAGTVVKKLLGQVERQSAAKRALDREVPAEALLAELATRQPQVVDLAAIGERLHLILNELAPAQRQVLVATLQGRELAEIARQLKRSERTVRRLLSQARKHFERRLLTEQEDAAATTEAPLSWDAVQAPLRFSDFLFERLLGAGGMGKVYRARDLRSNDRVAIKTLHKARQSDPRAIRQFVQESQILQTLSHPNIVRIRGLGQFPAGGFFLVMELVDGQDLQRRLAEGPLPRTPALKIVEEVAAAIQYAHEHRIIHCDLKPANVVVDARERAVVTDFGFARFHHPESPQPGHVGGTRAYLAPEVLRLQAPPTPAADIYALGALLWALVRGEPPPGLASLSHCPAGDAPLAAVCRRCLQDDPASRFATVTEFRAALATLPRQPR